MMPSANMVPGARAADVVDLDLHGEREREVGSIPRMARPSGALVVVTGHGPAVAVAAQPHRHLRPGGDAGEGLPQRGVPGDGVAVDRQQHVAGGQLGGRGHAVADAADVTWNGMPSSPSAAAVADVCESVISCRFCWSACSAVWSGG